MKKNIFLIGFSLLLLVNACNNKSSEPTAKDAMSSTENKNLTGSFTADSKTYNGSVSVQNFEATGQYSVLCKDNSDPKNSKLVQFIFKNESSARAGGSVTTAYDQGKDQTATETALSFDIKYRSDADSKGTVTVTKDGANNLLVFDNVTLKTIRNEKVVVSGKIPF